MIFYSILQVCKTVLYHSLSPAIELPERRGQVTATASSSASSSSEREGDREEEDKQEQREEEGGRAFMGLRRSKWIVFRLSLLFMIDSFGGSFILQVRPCPALVALP